MVMFNQLLSQLGFNQELNSCLVKEGVETSEIARVISEHKERYTVINLKGEYDCELLGKLRFSAHSRLDFPAVGDWVVISPYDEEKALIHKVLGRKNVLKRQYVGAEGEYQLIAANIDYAFIVESVNRDFNINRFERYLAICYEADIEPILVLNKLDLLEYSVLKELKEELTKRIPDVAILFTSCESNEGLDLIKEAVQEGKTYCFLGSSGVGKSSLINLISHGKLMKTAEIGRRTNRGKHTTSHRQLLVLEDGGILIDNPGLREVGVADAEKGLETVFTQIVKLGEHCKYRDCSHENETGCAVIRAVEIGEVDKDSYLNYLKLVREKQHYQNTEAEKRRKGKNLAKMIKQVKDKKSWK
jgi:ribosome biogenesis GTPase